MESVLAADPITLIVLLVTGGGVIYTSRLFVNSRDENDEKNRQAYQQMIDKIMASQEATVIMILSQRGEDNDTIMSLNANLTSMSAKVRSMDDRLIELSQIVVANSRQLSELIAKLSGVSK